MTTKLQEVMEMGNQVAAERASYAITVQEALDAGTLTDHDTTKRLLHEMMDENVLAEKNVPAEIKSKLIEAINELITEL
jgi:hypothetical protein